MPQEKTTIAQIINEARIFTLYRSNETGLFSIHTKFLTLVKTPEERVVTIGEAKNFWDRAEIRSDGFHAVPWQSAYTELHYPKNKIRRVESCDSKWHRQRGQIEPIESSEMDKIIFKDAYDSVSKELEVFTRNIEWNANT